MNIVLLEFPILVEKVDSHFHLSPLLTQGEIFSQKRYGDGVRAFKKSLRKQFAGREPTRELFEELLWYRFAPELRFDLPYFVMKSGMTHVEGNVAVAYYELNSHQYACLPKFNHLTLRIPEAIRGKEAVNDFVFDAISQFFRQERKANSNFNHHHYLSQKSDSMVLMEANTEIASQTFEFDYEQGGLFAFLSQNRAVNGAEELSKVAEDLSMCYPDSLQAAVFREEQTRLLRRSLFECKPQAIVLVGKRGVGRSNLIHSALKSYLDDNKQRSLHKLQKIWHVDPLRVISGMSMVGQWERRFESILERLKNRLAKTTKGRNTSADVLFVDNPVALLRIGKSSHTSLTLSHLLKTYLERRDIPTVLEATEEEWQKIQEMDRSFSDLFQVMRLQPLSEEQLNRIYVRQRARLEHTYHTTINNKALLTILKTEPRFRADGELPGSLLSMLETLAVRNQGKEITDARIYNTLESEFHVRKSIVDRDSVLKQEHVQSHFNKRLIGQHAACEALTKTVMTVKAQLTPLSKPLNTMFFIGPTGVGKTEAAKLLASYLFDRQECLVRIDMNEFSDHGAVERLNGSRQHTQGILTQSVRYTQSCVLLLDEIEKAHPRVHDLLLQLLDDGRLTDASGITTDFTQCIVIATSNVGAQEASQRMSFASSPVNDNATYIQALEHHFRPEFLNRINSIVTFNALQLGDMERLAQLHHNKLLQRDGFTRRKTILNVDKLCLDHLATAQYDPTLGARALKRNLEKSLTKMTAKHLTKITTTEPIILDIRLENNVPTISITQLSVVEPIENPINAIRAEFNYAKYTDIVNALVAADESIISFTRSDNQLLQYTAWRLSGNLRDISEPLQRALWERESRSGRQLPFVFKMPQIKMRTIPENMYKRGSLMAFSATKHKVLTTVDMREYIRARRRESDNAAFDDIHHQLRLMSESRRLIHASNKLVERGVDSGILEIIPLTTGMDNKQVRTLLKNRYVHLIDEKLGSVDKSSTLNGTVRLEVSGCGLHELLKHESGVHLCLGDNFKQIPVHIKYCQKDGEPESLVDTKVLDIVRLYVFDDANEHFDEITDLRLALSTKSLDVDEHCLFLLPALTSEEARP